MITETEFLKIRGNIKLAHAIHKRRMAEEGETPVAYKTFYARLKRNNWGLYKAIHTPSKVRKTSLWSKIKLFFKSLFK